ncbi:hypothetical protein ACFODO_22825 [Acinetobacter sichuanensis]|uniref:Uncharacterized protein n=1 Tax=Acinetobacter sichuanensis TaxID=2136183 RepID=A0A371YL29_9GAMM|nr:hypothetical protein [Acinetobacter sichuanensis]RFC82166.1 hypothetical protein C9E89_017965 [Acinetobacter sichuanensis]
MTKNKSIFIVLLLMLVLIPVCQELYKQRIYNQAMKEFCVQSHLRQSMNEILMIIAQHEMLKVYKHTANKMIIFPKKPSLDTALCQLEIKENRVINIRYSLAEYEREDL